MIKIVLIGGESTGKTTLSQALAKHYNAPLVPEFARGFLETRDLDQSPFCENDFEIIARGQWKSVCDIPSEQSLCICDTEAITTILWSKILIQTVPKEVIQIAKQQYYDLFLLTHPEDVPYEAEPNMRFLEKEKERLDFHQHLIQLLSENDITPHLIRGKTLEERLSICIKTIDSYLEKQK